MRTDIKGCSTCQAGSENYETFHIRRPGRTITRVQYDYRHTDGKLFSCVAATLEDCRDRRDIWLKDKEA